MNHKILKIALMVAALGLPLQVEAYSITVQNAGFESPATGTIAPGAPTFWTEITGGGSGAWNINAFPFGFWTVPAPEGNQIAWLSDAPGPGGHPGSPATLTQVLGDTLTLNTIYKLSGRVGHPIGYDTIDGSLGGAKTVYTVSLLANGFPIGSVAGNAPAGKFKSFLVTVDSTFLFALEGFPLEVRLESSWAQTGFDRIALNANSVPDGGLTALLFGMGMAGIGWMRRRTS